MNKRIVSWLISLCILAIPALAWFNRFAIFDAYRLRDYNPPAQIVRLADETTMTDSARRLFYVYKPALDDQKSFGTHCPENEQTIVLGCYVQHRGIYLYNVPDPRLKGVIQVTAAHELLHAAYDRLSPKDKARVDSLTEQALKNVTDERLLQTVENYRKKDASVVPNELHSILATELRNLPPELETYYKRYFANRVVIVDYADDYKAEFTQREQKVASIDAQLADLKKQIDALNISLESQQASLKAQFDSMQQQKRSGQIEAYNAQVPSYNQAVSVYNGAVNRQRSLVAQYNALVEERNTLAIEENQLIKALDSRETISTQ